MSMNIIETSDYSAAFDRAVACIREATTAGKIPLLAVSSGRAILPTRRMLADRDCGFGVSVGTLETLLLDGWNLNGDGRVPVGDVVRSFTLMKLIDDDAELVGGLSLARVLGNAVRRAAPLLAEPPAAVLDEAESAALGIIDDYFARLDDIGRIEPAQAMHAFAHGTYAQVYHLIVLDRRPQTLTKVERDILDTMDATVIVNEHTQASPTDRTRNAELEDLLGVLYRSDGSRPVRATGAFTCRFSSGPTAADRVIADTVIAESAPGRTMTVVHPDPVELFDRIGPVLVEHGIRCRVSGRRRFDRTDAGRLIIQLIDLIYGPEDAACATDVEFNDIWGTGFGFAFKSDKIHRGDRLVDRDTLLTDVAGWSDDDLHGVISLMENGEFGDALKILRAHIDEHPGPVLTRHRERIAAIDEAIGQFAVAKATGTDPTVVIRSLADSTVKIGLESADDEGARAADGCAPTVDFLPLSEAAILPPADTDILMLCELTAERYPVEDAGDAGDTLLEKLGLSDRSDPLTDIRALFAGALDAAREHIIVHRSLNDVEAKPAVAATIFDELVDCYRGDDTVARSDERDRRRAESLGIPTCLLPFQTETGEEDLLRNITEREPLPPSESVDVPTTGEISHAYLDKLIPEMWHENRILPGGPYLSPSQIESYLECPYQWFAKRRLKIESIDEGFDAMSRGSFIHKVLEEFMKQRIREGLGAVTPGNLEDAREQLATVFDGVLRRQPNEKSGSRYVARDSWESAIQRDLLTKLNAYLDTEAALLPGFEPKGVEVDFGLSSRREYAGIALHGKIDRIDVDPERNLAVAIDYKSSLNNDYRLHEKGAEAFTLPHKMQALMYSKVIPELPGFEGVRVVGALYVNVLKADTILGAWDTDVLGIEAVPYAKERYRETSSVPFADIPDFETLLSETEDAVRDRLKTLMSGDVQPCPISENVCEYCPVSVCEGRGRVEGDDAWA